MSQPTELDPVIKIKAYRRIYIDGMTKTVFMREIEALNRVTKMVMWFIVKQLNTVAEVTGTIVAPPEPTGTAPKHVPGGNTKGKFARREDRRGN
jgi:hypothetical protein